MKVKRWLAPLAALALFGILFGHHPSGSQDTYDYGVTVPSETPAPTVAVPTFPPGTSTLPVPDEAAKELREKGATP